MFSFSPSEKIHSKNIRQNDILNNRSKMNETKNEKCFLARFQSFQRRLQSRTSDLSHTWCCVENSLSRNFVHLTKRETIAVIEILLTSRSKSFLVFDEGKKNFIRCTKIISRAVFPWLSQLFVWIYFLLLLFIPWLWNIFIANLRAVKRSLKWKRYDLKPGLSVFFDSSIF